jgi:hypothetical protein
MEFQGAVSMGHLANLLSIRKWWDLVPDGLPDPSVADNHTIVTGGYGTYCDNSPSNDCGSNYVAAARTSDGALIIAYIPSDGAIIQSPNATGKHSLTVNLTKLSGQATAKWFNPATGAYTTIGTVPNTGSRTFTTPGGNGSGYNDWVLVIETSNSIPIDATPRAFLPSTIR